MHLQDAGVIAMPSHGPHRDQIKTLIDEYLSAVRRKDLDRLMACYTDDVVAYDLMPPLEYRGAHSYKKAWAAALSTADTFELEPRDLRVYCGGDVAFAHALMRYDVQPQEGGRMQGWFRWTAGLRRTVDTWKIIHEQSSVPTDMDTNRALLDLQP